MKYFSFLIGGLLCSATLFCQDIVVKGIPRDTTYNLHDTFIRQQRYHPFIKERTSKLPAGVKAYENIIYSRPNEGRELLLNIYRPDNKKSYPVLLMVHGGGWSSGTLSLQIPMAEQIALKGYVTIPVEYRLSPEAKYPAAVYDLKTAVRWIRANAEKYGIDTSFIAISGCSAGGQLAALIGTTNLQEAYEEKKEYKGYLSSVDAVVNIDGCTDFTVETALQDIEKSIQNNRLPASVKWFGGTINVKRDLWIAASPVFHVTQNSAPICFINSGVARFHDGMDDIIKKLNTYDIYSEIHTLPESPHTFWLYDPWFEPTVNYATDFMAKMIALKKAKE